MTRELEQQAQERLFYRQLLELTRHDDPASLVDEALALLVRATGAREGYLEIADDGTGEPRSWAARHGCDDDRILEIRGMLSSGIMAEAMASGETVLTVANEDPRFQDRESVREAKIESVLCAPIGSLHPLGVVYLQGLRPESGRRFGQREADNVKLFTSSLVPTVERLVSQERLSKPAFLGAEFGDAIGRSAAMRRLAERLRLAGPLDIHVLLTGPTGTGKTFLARVIHRLSLRRGAFIEVNCAAIPEALFESELFGAERGAHSTADRDILGKVMGAEGGTLFLDEIAELPLTSQAKLLQFLQSREFFPLGSTRPRTADVRVIAATNHDLTERVKAGDFREDLFYRLRVLEQRVPSLAERRDDILPLATHFIHGHCERHGFKQRRLSLAAQRGLALEEWPGNVRELDHCLERGLLSCELRGGERLDVQDLWPNHPDAERESETLDGAVRAFKSRLLRSALSESDWNVAETARRLDIARSHLYTMIRTYGLTRS